MTESLYFETTGGRVHALRFGRGKSLLIALHGYSDQARMFLNLGKFYTESFTVLAIDLPFHGQTVWHKRDFTPQDFFEIIAQILEKEGVAKYSLLGFSFGARLALAMLPNCVPQLEQLFLHAPDGLKTQGMGLATRTPIWLRRWLFQRIKNPARLAPIIRLGQTLGLISPTTHRFLNNQWRNPVRLERAFVCWLALGNFRFRKSEIRKILQKSKLPTAVFIGLNDPLISYTFVQGYFADLPQVVVHVKPGGHELLD